MNVLKPLVSLCNCVLRRNVKAEPEPSVEPDALAAPQPPAETTGGNPVRIRIGPAWFERTPARLLAALLVAAVVGAGLLAVTQIPLGSFGTGGIIAVLLTGYVFITA